MQMEARDHELLRVGLEGLLEVGWTVAAEYYSMVPTL